MRTPVVLVTGASGELGHGLLAHFRENSEWPVVTLDLQPLADELAAGCEASLVGDILDDNLLQSLVSKYEIREVYHLAALLSTSAEYSPQRGHEVNVEGTLKLLHLAHQQAAWADHPVKFLFPSSIAAYGLPSREEKDRVGKVRETEHTAPTTMYGCNKLYCELLGNYFTSHFQQLAAKPVESGIDFRSLRYPGLISAETVPTGGTSDYAPEMIHAAAEGKPYACFVDAEARLPFMTMPDAIRSLIQLAAAPAEALGQRIYNVTSFSLSAGEIADRVRKGFPSADITFAPDVPRARIVDSWPADVDDTPARRDWGWAPEYRVDEAFESYLIPRIAAKYRNA